MNGESATTPRNDERDNARLEARRTLGERFRARVQYFAARRLGDSQLSGDVAQETLKRVVTALDQDRIQNLAALSSFVYETARHVCQETLRKSSRRNRAHNSLTHEPLAPVSDALTELIATERRNHVLRALSELNEDDQELLRLFYFEELPSLSIADRLRVNQGTLRVRKHRALQRLAEKFTKDGNASRRQGT